MKAIILAAGFGKRLLPLTAKIPKPLLKINNKLLIEYSLFNLKRSGIKELIINLHYLGTQIKRVLGDGSKWGMHIDYLEEPILLDTGGAIVNAIKHNLLREEPFIVVSSDLITDFNFSLLKLSKLAHLILVPNPDFNPKGDFIINENNNLGFINQAQINYTYGNIGIFDPQFFAEPMEKVVPLVNFINRAITQQQITAEVYHGLWINVGTLKELEKAERAAFKI